MQAILPRSAAPGCHTLSQGIGGSIMQVLEALLMYQNTSSEDTTYHRMIRTILDNLETIRNATIYDTADLCYQAALHGLCDRNTWICPASGCANYRACVQSAAASIAAAQRLPSCPCHPDTHNYPRSSGPGKKALASDRSPTARRGLQTARPLHRSHGHRAGRSLPCYD